jgi:tetratricopeptide (TPR) repeat protein
VDDKITAKWYAVIALSPAICLLQLFVPEYIVTFNKTSILILILISYCTIRGILSESSTLDISICLSLVLLYLIFQTQRTESNLLDFFFIGIAFCQAIYALLQYTLILPTDHTFRILGSYGNPAGLATSLICTFPLIFTFAKKYKTLTLLFSLVIFITIVLSESRAGLLSVTIVSCIYIFNNLPKRIYPYKNYMLLGAAILSAMGCMYLFYLKQNSAIGRTLMWNVTSTMIADDIAFGNGAYAFQKNYMLYQAEYFSRNPESNYALLASNMMSPFNEYLLFLAKYGLLGFSLFIGIIYNIKRNNDWSSPYFLSLIAIGIFSFFSYPFQYPITWIIMIYSIVQLSKNERIVLRLSKNWSRLILLSISTLSIYFLIKDIKFEYNWNKTAKSALTGETTGIYKKYGDLYQEWNGNHLFLYNYAAELNHLGDFNKSIEILRESLNYWNDYDIQILLADNYIKLEKWHRAEPHLKMAANMCPNRFLPLFYLHEIYVKTNKPKALNMAKKILKKEVKIQSSTILFIQAEMKKYLNNTQSLN